VIEDIRPSGQTKVSFGTAFRTWLKLGLISFGVSAGQIAIMHRDPVSAAAGARRSGSCTL